MGSQTTLFYNILQHARGFYSAIQMFTIQIYSQFTIWYMQMRLRRGTKRKINTFEPVFLMST